MLTWKLSSYSSTHYTNFILTQMKRTLLLMIVFTAVKATSQSTSPQNTYSFSILSNIYGSTYLSAEFDRPKSKHWTDVYRLEGSWAAGIIGVETGNRFYWLDKKGKTEGIFSELGVGVRYASSTWPSLAFQNANFGLNTRLHIVGYKAISQSGRFANSISFGLNTDFRGLADGYASVPGTQMFPLFMRWQVGFVK